MNRQLIALLTMWALAGAATAAAQSAAPSDEHEGHAGQQTLTFGALTVQGFSDLTFRAERFNPQLGASTNASTFALGQFSLFLSARIAENVTIVSETALKLSADGRQAQSVELERIYIKYALSDAFKLAAGRTHTALGYWNEAFHHGGLLHPTVARPEILRFGGVMPLHSVGLEMTGRVPITGDWDFSYIANIANGRARDFSATQGAVDVNAGKAVAGKVSISRHGRRNVTFGPMIYVDTVPPDPARGSRQNELSERISGVHLVYRDPTFELLSEYFRMRHETGATGAAFDHEGWYAIAVLRPWLVKPYIGLDVAQFDTADPYLQGGNVSVRRRLAGLRIDVNAYNAVKIEYRHERRVAGGTHALVINTAFAF